MSDPAESRSVFDGMPFARTFMQCDNGSCKNFRHVHKRWRNSVDGWNAVAESLFSGTANSAAKNHRSRAKTHRAPLQRAQLRWPLPPHKTSSVRLGMNLGQACTGSCAGRPQPCWGLKDSLAGGKMLLTEDKPKPRSPKCRTNAKEGSRSRCRAGRRTRRKEKHSLQPTSKRRVGACPAVCSTRF